MAPVTRSLAFSPTGNDLPVDAAFTSLTITVDPLRGVASIAHDASSGEWSLNYTRNVDFNDGTDVLTYEVCIDDCCSTNMIVFYIDTTGGGGGGGGDGSVLAIPDLVFIRCNDTVSIDVTDNDIIDSVATLVVTQAPDNGAIVQRTDGTFVYTSADGASVSGVDSFLYRVCDTDDECSESAVVITSLDDDCPDDGDDDDDDDDDDDGFDGAGGGVDPFNLPPIGVDDTYRLSNPRVTMDPLANDFDLDGDQLVESTLRVVTQPSFGVVTAVNGTLVYVVFDPLLPFVGTELFEYEICDRPDGHPHQLCGRAVITISIDYCNIRALPDAVIMALGTDSLSFSPAGNDLPRALSFERFGFVEGPQRGNATVAQEGDGSWLMTYAPDADFISGEDYLIYEVCTGTCCGATTIVVIIDTSGVTGSLVLAVPTQAFTFSNGETSFSLASSVINLKDLALNFTLVTDVQHGVLTWHANGTVLYTPDANYVGTDHFVYEVCTVVDDDGAVQCSKSVATILVIDELWRDLFALVNLPPLLRDDIYTLRRGSMQMQVLLNDFDVDQAGALDVTTLEISREPT